MTTSSQTGRILLCKPYCLVWRSWWY